MGMHRSDRDHYCAPALTHAALPSTTRQQEDYRRGYADAQAERRSR